ncbi:protein mono-ADP-ribosyltransferase PARP14-like [Aplochiton taeniatus]
MMVETVLQLDEDDFSLEVLLEINKAVVSFNNSNDVDRLLIASQSHKKFKQHGLTAQELERPKRLRVENLPNTVGGEMLELYFEKVGGQPKNVTMIPEEQAAVITFEDPKIVEALLKRNHVISKVPIKVYPYYKSLCSALYGIERPTWKVPDAFTEAVHPAVRKYLLLKKLFNTINDQMKLAFCQVDLDQPEAKLSPLPVLMRQKGLSAGDLDRWKDNALDAFRTILAKYSAYQCAACVPVWKAVEKEVHSVVKQKAVLMFDSSRATLTMAGLHEDIQRMRGPVETIVLRATSQIERQRDGVLEEMEVSPARYYILQQDGLQKTAADICPEIALSYSENAQKLGISGLPAEVFKVKSWILERELQMKRRHLNVNPGLLGFLGSVDSIDMSQVLFTSQSISALYHVQEGEIVLVASSDKAMELAEHKMKTALSHQVVVVEDQAVLKKPEWKQLNAKLMDSCNSTKRKIVVIQFDLKRGNEVTVAGFLNPVKEVSSNLVGFVKKFSQVQEALRVKSCAVVKFIQEKKSTEFKNFSKEIQVSMNPDRPTIKICGPRLFVREAKASLQKWAQDLFTDELIIVKPGARKFFLRDGKMILFTVMKEHDCVVLLQEDHMLSAEEGEDEEESEGAGTSTCCEVRAANGVLVTVSRADICRFEADAVVNAANEDLRHIGGLALALLKAAGPELQKLSDDYVRRHGPLKPGEAVATVAGNLPCQYVVHAVGPRYSDWDKTTAVLRLRDAVHSSLREAVKAKCCTVAVPAISSGIFGFPLDLCTETIAQAVREYCDHPRGTGSLKEIYLVDNNDNTVRAMAKAVASQFTDLWPKLSLPPEGAVMRGQQKRGRGRDLSYEGAAYGGQPSRGRGHSGGRGGYYGPLVQEPVREDTRFEREDRSGCLDTQRTPEGLKITLRKGKIQEQLTDVIVNTIADTLDLSQGAVSNSILEAAGPRLQKAARVEAGVSRLKYGDVVVTDGFDLQCQRVFHAVCPQWNNGAGRSEEILMSIVRYCLKEAEKLKLASLSFPAIGTGNMGFPGQLVSRLMLDEVKTHSQTRTPTYLKEVAIVLHPRDTRTVDCFIREFRGQAQESTRQGSHGSSQSQPSKSSATLSHPRQDIFGQVLSPSLGVHHMQMAQVNFEVSSGDITKETSEVIVNSSNKDFNLKTGVSKAILDAAGLTVEMECSTIAQSRSSQASMIITSAGSLPCKNIVHIVGQNDPGRIKEVVYDVLKMCEEQKFASVSFPALGTGQGGASPAAVADAMIEAVVDFVKKKKGRYLNNVKILIFQPAMVNEFYMRMKKIEGHSVEERSIFTKIYDSFTSFFTPNEGQYGNEDMVMKGEEFSPAVFQLCAGSPRAISQAKDQISDLILREQAERTIKNPRISQLSPAHVDQLKELEKKLTVSIHMEKRGQDSFIRLEGLTRDVLSAEGDIRELVQKVEKAESDREKALFVSGVVEWQYQDRSGAVVSFDILTNYSLEEAFVSKRKVKIKIYNEEYTADIERVQNTTLWHSYQLKKKELEDKNKHQNNEKQLFHGTDAKSNDHINAYGFNRSYAGAHGAMFGNGSYFAVDPCYSARGYAKADQQGHKRMYMALVLVGDYTLGKQGIVVPPSKSSANTAELYDSVTDNPATPSMFVVFNDVQAYPEYLITMK